MTRRKIKKNKKQRKRPEPIFSQRYMLQAELGAKRNNKKFDDSKVLQDMIIDDQFDPYRATEYKYINTVAHKIGWSINRMRNAIATAKVIEAIEYENNLDNSRGEGSTASEEETDSTPSLEGNNK
jgi:hypothetical protein